jgi:hypothetical protein
MVGIGMVWTAAQAFAAGDAAGTLSPERQQAELEKQLDKVKADKSARAAVLESSGELAALKKAAADAEAALEKAQAANPKYLELDKARHRAKKALKKAENSGGADAIASAKKALADAVAARDAYLKEHADLAAAVKASDEADDAVDAAESKAKDGDAEYTALKQKEDELDKKLEAVKKQLEAAPKAE